MYHKKHKKKKETYIFVGLRIGSNMSFWVTHCNLMTIKLVNHV